MAEDWPRELGTDDLASFEISNRERALFLIHEYDLEAQLLAIRGLLHRNGQSDEALASQIKALDAETRKSTDGYRDHLQDYWIERLHSSVFQDAAHSMSAVGMLAPFVESLFVAVFKGLRANQQQDDVALNARAAALHDDYWDPHYVLGRGGRRNDIVDGIKQLSDSTGLTAFLPESLMRTLSALFTYRNKMFHQGFEWPLDERNKFEKTIRQKQWPSDWFTQSTSGGEPWIFYMSADFIQHCLDTIDQVLEGVGTYLIRSEQG